MAGAAERADLAPPRGVALPLGLWAAVTAGLAAVAALQLDWGWWIGPAAWGAVPVAWWLLKGPDESWGVRAPSPTGRSAAELGLAAAAVAGLAVWVATWAPATGTGAGVWIVMCLWAPLVEELFFRGWLQGALRTRLGAAGAVLLTAVCFGVSHAAVSLSWLGLATVAPGLLFGAVRERQSSLISAWLLHAAANAALLLFSPVTVTAPPP